MRVLAVLAAGLLLVASPPQAQQPPPAQTPPPAQAGQATAPPDAPQQGQPRPVIRSAINFVSVDVIVTDKKTGDVVLDMTKDDFDVREDRKPQKVDTFDLVNIAELTANTPAAPREIRSMEDEEIEARKPNVRLFVLLLDDYHVRRGNDLVVRKPLLDFVTNQLGPQDMVAVMYPLTPSTAITFTRNRSSLIESIEHFLGRKGDYTPRNEIEERYAYYPTVTVERIRDDVTLGALRGAAVAAGRHARGAQVDHLRQRRVHLEPAAAAQRSDRGDARHGQPRPTGAGRDRSARPVAGFFDSIDLIERLRDVFDIANRNNTSIYAVDPRGLTTFEYDVNQGVSLATDRTNLNSTMDTLRILADNTDGRAFVNRNDIGTAMKQIMRDASGYYLLGYTSTNAPTDGKFHAIDVKVKRPNVEVRARKGYWAYTIDDVARAKAAPSAGPSPEITNALTGIIEPAHGEHAARFWTGTARTAEGQTRLTFVWEALPVKDNAGRAGASQRAIDGDGRRRPAAVPWPRA